MCRKFSFYNIMTLFYLRITFKYSFRVNMFTDHETFIKQILSPYWEKLTENFFLPKLHCISSLFLFPLNCMTLNFKFIFNYLF